MTSTLQIGSGSRIPVPDRRRLAASSHSPRGVAVPPSLPDRFGTRSRIRADEERSYRVFCGDEECSRRVAAGIGENRNAMELTPTSVAYRAFLESVKDRVRRAQVGAALAANRELILLYWEIGREILTRQHEEGWGTKVIDHLSRDLRRSFPELKGFSARNLKYMRAFAEAWPDRVFVQQAVAQIPWGHNVRILDKAKAPSERSFYVEQTSFTG